jgi:tagatose 6-phosphate kinase
MCPSPAVDVTYRVAALAPEATNRVAETTHRPGGKGVNVARVLHRLAADVRAVIPLGGRTGDELAEGLTHLGIAFDPVAATCATRRTVTVVDDAGRATVLAEAARLGCWDELVDRTRIRADEADVVVVSGSLPADAPPRALAALLAGIGALTIVDTSGAALADAVRAGARLVKPNAAELTELTGERDPRTGALRLADGRDTTVVVSLGAEGLLAVSPEGTWQARPARRLDGNPTGAGDAAVAGLALGLSRGDALPELLAEAVAISSAAVLHPVAGDVDPDDVRALRAGVTVSRLDVEAVR